MPEDVKSIPLGDAMRDGQVKSRTYNPGTQTRGWEFFTEKNMRGHAERVAAEAVEHAMAKPRVPDAIRTTVVDYARRRQAAGAAAPTIAREVGFSVGAIRNWIRAETARLPFQPVTVRPAAVVSLPASGLAIVLPNGVRIEGLPLADVPALLAQLA